MLGMLVGSFAGGFLSDRFGRRPSLFLLALLCCSASLGGAFVQHFESYVFTRFLVGLGEGFFLY